MRQTCLDILMGEFRLGECTGQEGYFTPAWSKRAGWDKIAQTSRDTRCLRSETCGLDLSVEVSSSVSGDLAS
jgi:hypothetical protein